MVQTHHYNCYRGQSNQKENQAGVRGSRRNTALVRWRDPIRSSAWGDRKAPPRSIPLMHRALRKMFLEDDPRSRRREAEVIGALASVLDRVKTVMKHAALERVHGIDG
jgi:hypothetical protein